jgi:hypothetical protein
VACTDGGGFATAAMAGESGASQEVAAENVKRQPSFFLALRASQASAGGMLPVLFQYPNLSTDCGVRR